MPPRRGVAELHGFHGVLGLEEVRREIDALEVASVEAQNLESVFTAQQTILSNIMVVSALLLGFIVSGTMLSVVLTGSENFGVEELITFFRWTGLAAGCAFLSLITSFLTSVWGAGFMTSHGPEEAAKALTTRSVLRRITAEGSLYMSMFFFLVSLNTYVYMVYTGPDICPSYRGGASFCARVGRDLYQAGTQVCKGTCATQHMSMCQKEADSLSCLCDEWCRPHWETSYDFSRVGISMKLGGNITLNSWFGYWSPVEPVHIAIKEKIVTKASDVMCNHETLETAKDECFAAPGRDCSAVFTAWSKAEECLEGSVQDADKCRKVCSWLRGQPPRKALHRLTLMLFVPLGITILILTLGRTVVLLMTAIRACQEQHAAVRSGLRQMVAADDSSEESSGTGLGGGGSGATTQA